MRKSLFFCIYKEENDDLKILTIMESIKGLCSYLEKSKSSLYRLGLKKKAGSKLYLEINKKKYVIIVDKD